jgi:outer membrane protein assembly factor BamB
MRLRILLATVTALVPLAFPADTGRAGVDWPGFRGPRAAGIAEGRPLPTRWDTGSSENVRWKTPIPGLGHSSPVVWGDAIFLTSAISSAGNTDLKIGLYGNIEPVKDDSSHEFKVYCLDKRTGKMRWERTAWSGVPRIKRHTKATHANSTLATDGRVLVALFGSEGLYTYDLDGKLLWKKDLGVLDSGYYQVPAAQWEFGASPLLHAGVIFVQADVQQGSFLAAFDSRTGREIWRVARQDVPTWRTPAVYESGGRTLVVVNGWKHIGAYDARTGQEVWKMQGGGDIPVPTPVVAHDLIFITSAHGRMAPVYAIRSGASGDITLQGDATSNEHVAWSAPRDGAYMVTPLVYGELLYVCRHNGVLNVYEAKTGNRLYQQRLGEGTSCFSASPVAGDGKIYFTSEEGDVYVVKAGPTFDLLAKNTFSDVSLATPALSEGLLIARIRSHVLAIQGAEARK